MIDLMSATQAAVFAALIAGVPESLCPVFDVVPQDTKPPFMKVGAIDSDNEGGKGEQLERLTVEVVVIYQGQDRGEMLAMMHAARDTLDGKAVGGEGVSFQRPRFLTASASDASQQDGVTYAGLLNFEIWAEPA